MLATRQVGADLLLSGHGRHHPRASESRPGRLAHRGRHAHVARQQETIKTLTQGGHETDVAESMLHAFERSLEAFEHHRALILDRLAGSGSSPFGPEDKS
jgi:hypothetical protein